jgi:hypothetical protein
VRNPQGDVQKTRAFSYIKFLAGNQHLHDFTPQRDSSFTGSHQMEDLSPITALSAFVDREWWHRAWVVQEAILPEKALLVCGSDSIPWSTIEQASLNWREHAKTCCAEITRHYPPNQHWAIRHVMNEIKKIARLREERARDIVVSLPILLSEFRARGATDPRDKIFAFIGLMRQQDPGNTRAQIVANYTLELLQVYEQAVSSIIANTKSLEILISTNLNRKGSIWPSWVTDWSVPLENSQLSTINLRRSLYYSASGSEQAQATVRPNSILSVSAIFIDKTFRVGSFLKEANDWGQLLAVFKEWKQICGLPDRGHEQYPTGGTVLNAHWRTTLGNLISVAQMEQAGGQQYRKAVDADFDSYKTWWVEAEEKGSGVIDHIGVIILGTFATRTLFITLGGLFGIGPMGMREDDEIYVFLGSNVPFVLRPLNYVGVEPDGDGVDCSELCHRLVGDCYLHGFMEGLALNLHICKRQTVNLR